MVFSVYLITCFNLLTLTSQSEFQASSVYYLGVLSWEVNKSNFAFTTFFYTDTDFTQRMKTDILCFLSRPQI